MSTEFDMDYKSSFGNKNQKNYIIDFRVMTPEEIESVNAKAIDDEITFDPPAPNAAAFLSFKWPITANIPNEWRKKDEEEAMQKAEAEAHDIQTQMINEIMADHEKLAARIRFLEETNGIKLAIAKTIGKGM
jgi:hypothetical protein